MSILEIWHAVLGLKKSEKGGCHDEKKWSSRHECISEKKCVREVCSDCSGRELTIEMQAVKNAA